MSASDAFGTQGKIKNTIKILPAIYKNGPMTPFFVHPMKANITSKAPKPCATRVVNYSQVPSAYVSPNSSQVFAL